MRFLNEQVCIKEYMRLMECSEAQARSVCMFLDFVVGSEVAVGAHLKNPVAFSVGDQVFLSQHIGDLETEQANTAFRRVIAGFDGTIWGGEFFLVTDDNVARIAHFRPFR